MVLGWSHKQIEVEGGTGQGQRGCLIKNRGVAGTGGYKALVGLWHYKLGA